MQSIAALRCGALLAASWPQDLVWACYRDRPKRCRWPWKKISEARPAISSMKLKPWLRDRQGVRVLLLVIVVVAGVGSGIGPAGGTGDVGAVGGDGDASRSRRRGIVRLAHATPMHVPAGSMALEPRNMT